MTDRRGGAESGREGAPPERERVVEALCEHYAQDRLEIAEFERRVDLAHRARTRDELSALLADLPSLAAPVPAPQRPERPRPSTDVALPPGTGRVTPSRTPEHQTEIAVWSGRTRKGSWIPARTIRALGFMGSVELDFREALFGTDEIRIQAVALMGAVEIIVPPGIRVETEGFAIMGGFEEESQAVADASPDAPVIRVSGFAMMGAVEIVSRYPGETARQARVRRKQERRELRPGG